MMHAYRDAPSSPEIAVIVVNYGTADMAIRAVESVLAHSHEGRSVEVHLVDNASPDGDANRLSEVHESENWGDRVVLWLESTNHGFARGNNVVLRALAEREKPPEYVFLLNPDAWIEGEAIAALANEMDKFPKAAAVGGGNFDGVGGRTTAAFRFPGIISEFERTVNFGPVSRILNAFRVPLPPDHPAGLVDWVSGASVLFRFRAIQEVGFFDAGYFLYYEEVDLMRRLKGRGWEVRYLPEARVQHIGQAATGVEEVARKPGYLYRSWRRYFSYSGRTYALLAAGFMVVGGAVGWSIATVRRRPIKLPAYFFRDHWHFVVAPLLGLRRDSEYESDTDRSKGLA